MQNAAIPNNTQEPIDIDQIKKEIECTCSSLAQTLGKDYLPEALPVLEYEAIPIDLPKENSVLQISEAYHHLLKAVECVKPVLYSILEGNGIFVAGNMN